MSMSLFDIIGPVMVGPSSSHTAGVVRIGNVVHKLLGTTPSKAVVRFCGSFATTYQGHGSDKAIVAGMLGMSPEDERIRDSLSIAQECGMQVELISDRQPQLHPNTILVTAEAAQGGALSLTGYSVGGGNIRIARIGDIAVEFTGKYNTLIVGHRDTPGMVAQVTQQIAGKQINIAYMKMFRSLRGGDAIMILETDEDIYPKTVELVETLPGVRFVTSLPSLF